MSPMEVAPRSVSERYAVWLIAASSLLISVNGFLFRSIESANEWQVIFGRQAFFTPAILLVLLIRYRAQLPRLFLEAGWVGLAAGICLGLANPTVILAMTHTTVANAMFILGACPLITAVLARIFLGERLLSRKRHYALALVIDYGDGAPCPTCVIESVRSEIGAAIVDLANRERMEPTNIGFVDRNTGASHSHREETRNTFWNWIEDSTTLATIWDFR